MELIDLISYAKEEYGIEEDHKWPDYPAFSVLCHPETGQWLALLIKYWDEERGEIVELCDIRCGTLYGKEASRPYIKHAFKMKNAKWKGVVISNKTDRETVFGLFDRAVSLEKPSGALITLASYLVSDKAYGDVPLPFSETAGAVQKKAPKNDIPQKIREMKSLYEYRSKSEYQRAKNFYSQGKFMEDYEDDYPCEEEFFCYYPTYHDMSVPQLRYYFTWRTKLRKGDVKSAPASYAYVYIYELLNGIGAGSVEDKLKKLKEFETVYVDGGFGDDYMRLCLERWVLELAVVEDAAVETVLPLVDRSIIGHDRAMHVLKNPADCTDKEVFESLFRFGGKKTLESPSVTSDPARAARVFSNAWRSMVKDYKYEKNDFFDLCFGRRKSRLWNPLSNAVYCIKTDPAEGFKYELNDCRSYTYKNLKWRENCYYAGNFNTYLLDMFLREVDCVMREYYKTGWKLKENESYAWMRPFIAKAIRLEAAAERAAREAARPKIEIDLSGLEKIRADALKTRDSLLTEEERFEEQPEAAHEERTEKKDDGAAAEPQEDVLLSDAQRNILAVLLEGGDPSDIIKAEGLMPSITADIINEALFDTVGDIVVTCENDKLSLVEDYIDDIAGIIGG